MKMIKELTYNDIKPKEIVMEISVDKALSHFKIRARIAEFFFLIGAAILDCNINIELKTGDEINENNVC